MVKAFSGQEEFVLPANMFNGLQVAGVLSEFEAVVSPP
jgi:hypothetical protein